MPRFICVCEAGHSWFNGDRMNFDPSVATSASLGLLENFLDQQLHELFWNNVPGHGLTKVDL